MRRSAWITTSWDDGHPLDLRVAELLSTHGLAGTFYIPRKSDRQTMTESQIRQVASRFEVGGHTLDHVVLTAVPPELARSQIVSSKAWLEDVTGSGVAMFCPPEGRFGAEHLAMVREAGFIGIRTVEFFSLDRPRQQGGLLVMPTTVHACPHRLGDYARNMLKRRALGNLWRYIVHGRCTDWVKLAESFLEAAVRRGGVFHLWGHSWELEEKGQWDRLEEVLCWLSAATGTAIALSNARLCTTGEVPAVRAGDAR